MIMLWNKINSMRRLLRVGFFKTVFINFYKLPFRQAIRFPIIVSKNTYFYDLSGSIVIEGEVKTGNIRIGFFGEDTQVWKNDAGLLKVNGKLVFRGNARLGVGVTVRVEKGAVMVIGNDVFISNNTKLICYEHIDIGEHSRIAWETQIIDTTFHFIKTVSTGEISELSSPIKIGKNNWIGNRSNIMKGAVTPDYCIIASGSLCNKALDVPNNSLLAGTPVKLIRTDLRRVLMEEEQIIKKELEAKIS